MWPMRRTSTSELLRAAPSRIKEAALELPERLDQLRGVSAIRSRSDLSRSVLRGPFDVVDDKNFHGSATRFEPQPQLLAYGREQSRLFVDAEGRHRVSYTAGAPLQIDIEYAGQVG